MIAMSQINMPSRLPQNIAILENAFRSNADNFGMQDSASEELRRIKDARPVYDSMISQQPNSVKFWSIYIEHEMRAGCNDETEKLFQRCLLNVVNINIFKLYLAYIKKAKAGSERYNEMLAKVYEFVIEKIGMDINSFSIWKEYVDFLVNLDTIGAFADKQKLSAIRLVYQKAIANPIIGIDQLWNDYCNFETSLNPINSRKMQDEKNKEFVQVKNVAKEIERITKGINKNLPSMPISNSPEEVKQLEMWMEYINYERSNPLKSEDQLTVVKRVMFAYEQCLLCFGLHPQIWIEAAQYLEENRKQLSDNQKAGKISEDDISKMYERAIQIGLKNSLLIYFKYADLEESRKKYEKVHNIYKRALELDSVETTLIYIQYMKFVKRTEGITFARKIFRSARNDTRSKYHVYVAAAKLESAGYDGNQIATKIFELATKNFANKGESQQKLKDIKDKYAETGIVSDLLSSESNVLTKEVSDIISEYCFLDLLPCNSNELKSITSTSVENTPQSQKKTSTFKTPNIINNLLKILPPPSRYTGPTVNVFEILKNVAALSIPNPQGSLKRKRENEDDDDDDDDSDDEQETSRTNTLFSSRLGKKMAL